MKTNINIIALTIFIFLSGNSLHAQYYPDIELSMSKSFQGESVESSKKFMVTKEIGMLRLEINGVVKEGVITITLQKPDGSEFESIDLDNSANIDYKRGFDLQKDPTGMVGEWQIKIKTKKAQGYYKLMIQIYKAPEYVFSR